MSPNIQFNVDLAKGSDIKKPHVLQNPSAHTAQNNMRAHPIAQINQSNA